MSSTQFEPNYTRAKILREQVKAILQELGTVDVIGTGIYISDDGWGVQINMRQTEQPTPEKIDEIRLQLANRCPDVPLPHNLKFVSRVVNFLS